jgi:hypothetical protein
MSSTLAQRQAQREETSDLNAPPPPDKYYGRTLQTWQKLSSARKKELKNIQRLEEDDGQVNPHGPCERCHVRGFTCKTFTLIYKKYYGATEKCSRCIYSNKTCVPGPNVDDATENASSQDLLTSSMIIAQKTSLPVPAAGPLQQKSAYATVFRLTSENEALDAENEELSNDLARTEQELLQLRNELKAQASLSATKAASHRKRSREKRRALRAKHQAVSQKLDDAKQEVHTLRAELKSQAHVNAMKAAERRRRCREKRRVRRESHHTVIKRLKQAEERIQALRAEVKAEREDRAASNKAWQHLIQRRKNRPSRTRTAAFSAVQPLRSRFQQYQAVANRLTGTMEARTAVSQEVQQACAVT